MLTLRLRDLLNEFEEWVAEGEVKKMPYQEWRWLKQHENDHVRIERNGWGDLGIFSETCFKFLVEGLSHNDGSFGEYLDFVYCQEFDKDDWYYNYKDTSCYSKWRSEPVGIDSDIPTVQIDKNGININGKNLNKKIDEAAGFSINRKENNSMTNLIKNFDFGSCENDYVKVSVYGLAVKNATGTWVSYDSKSDSVIDVDILNFEGGKYLYKIPVATKDIKKGDVIIHNRKPMFVNEYKDGRILAIDPAAGEEKLILPTKNAFGFDFYTKVINLFEGFAAGASEDAPFGNMLPLMLLNDSNKSKDMLPLLFMMNGGKFDMSNPMMLYFLMNDNKNNDILPLMFFANGTGIGFGKSEAEARKAAGANA